MTRVLAGLVGLAVALGAADALAQRTPFAWDIPKKLSVVGVPGIVMSDGIPVKMTAVRSAEKLDIIGQHLVKHFQESGLIVPPVDRQPQLLREPMITAIDTRALISYTAILQPNPDGTTTVYLGEANLSQGRQRQSSVAPVFPGGSGLLTTEEETARTLTYSVVAKQADVEVFYRNELGKAGFRETEPRLFRSEGEEVKLSFAPAKEGRLAVVVLRRTVTPEAPSPTGD